MIAVDKVTLELSREEADAVRFALGHYLRATDPQHRPKYAIPADLLERRRPVFRAMNRIDVARADRS